jgi:hypothetical protein
MRKVVAALVLRAHACWEVVAMVGGACGWCKDEAGGAGCAFSSSKAYLRSKASKAGASLLEAGGSGMGGRPWRSVGWWLRRL